MKQITHRTDVRLNQSLALATTVAWSSSRPAGRAVFCQGQMAEALVGAGALLQAYALRLVAGSRRRHAFEAHGAGVA